MEGVRKVRGYIVGFHQNGSRNGTTDFQSQWFQAILFSENIDAGKKLNGDYCNFYSFNI